MAENKLNLDEMVCLNQNEKTGYAVYMVESSHTPTAREKLQLVNMDGATRINDVLNEYDVLRVIPRSYFHLHVENPAAKEGKDKSYEQYVIVGTEVIRDNNGVLNYGDDCRFISSSGSMWASFLEIVQIMKGSGDKFATEPYSVAFSKGKAKKTGRPFIRCSIGDFVPDAEHSNAV